MDMLLSTGEGVSIALLAIAIQAAGADAVSFNAMQVGILTEDVHTKARIKQIKTEKLEQAFEQGKIVVVAGFQGVTDSGEITTLGRGGSDTSAVALAAALGAHRCDIYTDVDGVYTTDPRVVPNATRLETVSYDEMLELACAGAGVLHPRSVETAKHYGVPMRVRSSFKYEDLGTLITGVEKMEIHKAVTGVAADLSQSRVVVKNIPDKPGSAAKLFGELAARSISVDMIIQSYTGVLTNDIAFTINSSDAAKVSGVIDGMFGEVEIADNFAKVSIIGAGMIDRPGIAAVMFETLAAQEINIAMISTSEIKISCLVDKSDARKALKALHGAFEMECDEIAEVKGDLPPV
jgi:aspartate kinase